MDTKEVRIAVLGGAVAGMVGTLAMDLVWFRRSKKAGAEGAFSQWEFTDATSFDEAGAPAQVAAKAASVLGVDIPERQAGTTTNVAHWATGAGWGIAGSMFGASVGMPALARGLVSGGAAFVGAYTILPLLGIYNPIWNYDGKTLWKDATAHATYGVVTGSALAAINAVVRTGR